MTNPPDVQRTLDHCMMHIKGASDAMRDDMHNAAMRLGTAEMMLASASNAVHRHAAQLTGVPAQRDTGEQPAPGNA
jgi:hypothetical protein